MSEKYQIKLVDLNAHFMTVWDENGISKNVETIPEADGVLLLCPGCFIKNKGPIGTHSIICWRPHVPKTVPPVPGRWEFYGTGIPDLTLKAGSSSIFCQPPGCGAHFFIENGWVREA